MNFQWLRAYHTTVEHERCEISKLILKDLKIYDITLKLSEYQFKCYHLNFVIE